jgi:hypothetical protein
LKSLEAALKNAASLFAVVAPSIVCMQNQYDKRSKNKWGLETPVRRKTPCIYFSL